VAAAGCSVTGAQRDYGESQVPPFCAQLDVSVSTVSATPE
jgi:hypothetical protein